MRLLSIFLTLDISTRLSIVFVGTLLAVLIHVLEERSFNTDPLPWDDMRHRALGGSTYTNSTATDDHGSACSGGGGHAESLFGVLIKLDPVISTMSFLLIVVAVLFVEFVFHYLNHMAHDTPFVNLMPVIEKELMIAGCTAFAFKVIANATSGWDERWFLALEYADLVVPVFSFIYCFVGLLLIGSSLRQCDIWTKAYHLKLLEILDEYFDEVRKMSFRLTPISLNRVMREMEFRIFHNIFCDAYNIQRKAFAFHDYVEKVNDKFVKEIIEIRPVDWFSVSVVFLLNLVRLSKRSGENLHCVSSGHGEEVECANRTFTVGFVFVGFILLFVVMAIAVAARILEIQIMRKKGIPHYGCYHSFLEYMEKQEDVETAPRMDKEQLRNAAKTFLKEQNQNKSQHDKAKEIVTRLNERLPQFVSTSMKLNYLGGSFRGSTQASVVPTHEVLHTHKEQSECGSGVCDDALDHSSHSSFGDKPGAVMPHGAPAHREQLAPEVEKEPQHTQTVDSDSRGVLDTSPRLGDEENDVNASPKIGRESLFAVLAKSISFVAVELDTEYDPRQDCFANEDISSVFWIFCGAEHFFEVVQAMMMLLSLYLALWLTNFLVAAHDPRLVIVSLIPGVLGVLLFVYMVRTAALLKAIHRIDSDAVLEVLEETENSQQLCEMMRTRLLEKLHVLGEPQAQLFDLFSEIDLNQNGMLTKDELGVFMNALGIHFSKKRWEQVFHQIDADYDEKVTFQEFFMFIFPEHDLGLALERKRLQILGTRVRTKAKEHNEEMQRPFFSLPRRKSTTFAAEEGTTEQERERAQAKIYRRARNYEVDENV